MGHVIVDFTDQVAHAAERPPPNRLLRDKSEPALHLIEPARVGGRVVNVEAAMACEPSLDRGMFVGGVVVDPRPLARDYGAIMMLLGQGFRMDELIYALQQSPDRKTRHYDDLNRLYQDRIGKDAGGRRRSGGWRRL